MPVPGYKNTTTSSRKVWVLAPQLQTGDANVDYYYDFSQSILEYEKAFGELNTEWVWQPVTLKNYQDVIDMIEMEENAEEPIILNLCDGDEINDTPGISVLKYLHRKKMIYTGANELFYRMTTSKIVMKQAFDKAAIPTAAWQEISEDPSTRKGIFDKLGSPLIVKPAISGGSMGVGLRSVVTTNEELDDQMKLLLDGYRGWSLTAGGVIAEQFINGPEFTSFIVGDADKPNKRIIYPPVERVFHPSLPDTEKFLSFDRLWETYDDETPLPNEEPFYTYHHHPDKKLVAAIDKLSWDAYVSVGGKGYGRIDIRMDKESGRLYVLEVNAQCGISEDEDYTSIGAILRLGGHRFSEMLAAILENAVNRSRKPARVGKKAKSTKEKQLAR